MAPDRWVVIDDADPSINYAQGPWFLDTSGSLDKIGNFGPPYLETVHRISTNGSISFEFNGTAVEVWGTNAYVSNFQTNPDPTLECFVDDVSIGRDNPFEFPENNWRFCNQTGIPDGHHKLRIEVKVQSPTQKFWLDQIRYIPSPNMRLDNKVIFIDNTDPAVQFDAQWSGVATTSNLTTKQHSVAQVNFIGTSISWYALIPQGWPLVGAQGSWSIDQGEGTQFLLKGLSPSDLTQWNAHYFTTPEVEAGPHVLTVTFLGSNETTPLVLDYLYVKNGTFPDSASATSVPTPSDHSSDNDSGTPSHGTPLGTIIGSVLGGLALLICIAAALLFYRRRRARQREVPTVPESQHPTPTQSRLSQSHPYTALDMPSYMVQTGGQLSPPKNPRAHSSPHHPTSGLPRKLRHEVERGRFTIHHASNPLYSQTADSRSSPPPTTAQPDSSWGHQLPGAEWSESGDDPPHYTWHR